MPSGITHILLTKQLQVELPEGKLNDIFAFASDYLTLGSVAPDLPYASKVDADFILTRKSSLADKFHYEQTNQIPLRAVEKLKSLKDTTDQKIHFQMFAFFLGYISHVFADGIIHPFIRDKVGDYAQHKDTHRELELKLDVLYYNRLTEQSGFPLNLTYSDLQKELLNYSCSQDWTNTFNLFKELIYDVYQDQESEKDIMDFSKDLKRMYNFAGMEFLQPLKKLKWNTLQFKELKDINAEETLILTKTFDKRVHNFLHADKVDYFENCVPRFFKMFIPIAQKAFAYIFEDGMKLTETDIPAIDLDTGRSLDLQPEFWK